MYVCMFLNPSPEAQQLKKLPRYGTRSITKGNLSVFDITMFFGYDQKEQICYGSNFCLQLQDGNRVGEGTKNHLYFHVNGQIIYCRG